MSVAYLDTETLGLDPFRHPIWEIAIIVDDVEHCWQVEMTGREIDAAERIALDINGFDKRYRCATSLTKRESAERVEDLLVGRHIVGAVPSFDEERLRLLCNAALRDGKPPEGRYPWHYHLIDVEAMAVGYLAGLGTAPPTSLPWKSHALSAALGVVEPVEDEHTALGDARWAKRLYERMTQPLPVWSSFKPGRIWLTPEPIVYTPPVIAAGNVYEWSGLPGQYDNEARIELVSMTASGSVNTQIIHDDGEVALSSMHASDLVAAVERGWLVLVAPTDGATT